MTTDTEANLSRDGYRKYTLNNAALRRIAESGGDLIIKRVPGSAFLITDSEDTDWIDGLTIEEVAPIDRPRFFSDAP